VVFSPGPGRPADAGNLLHFVKYFSVRLPVLGVCLGHQAIGEVFGGNVSKADTPMHGKRAVINTENDIIFQNIPSRFSIVRYHSLILSSITNDLNIIAKTDSGEIMAIKHNKLPVWGVQFHPEAYLSEYGNTIIGNWVNYIKHP
jgi:anthranilate synthase/aminodeoxychorismate synthase-like glutamine amidotransferase